MTSPADDRLITRPFVIVSVATLAFFMYLGVLLPVLPRLIEERLGGSEIDIGLNLAVFSIAAVGARPRIGALGERWGGRWLMTVGALTVAASAAVSAAVMNRWLLLPLRAVQGAGEAAVFVGGSSLITGFAAPRRRAEAASYYSVAVFTGVGVGPLIGEAAINSGGFSRGFLTASACALVAAALSRLAPPRSDPEVPSVAPTTRYHRGALRTGTVLALGMMGFASFNAFMPEYARSVGLHGAGPIFATYAAVCLLIRVVAAKVPERIGLRNAATFALVGIGSGLAVFTILDRPAGLFVGTVVLGAGISMFYPSLQASTVNAVPDAERVRVISTFTMFFEVGVGAGALVLGALANATSKRWAFAGGAVCCAVGLVVLRRVLPSGHVRKPLVEAR